MTTIHPVSTRPQPDRPEVGPCRRFTADRFSHGLSAVLALLLSAGLCSAAPLSVTQGRAAQRAGTKLVDVNYAISGGVPPYTVSLQGSLDGGVTWTLPVTTVSGDVGAVAVTGTNRLITWNAGMDWAGQVGANVKFRVTATDTATPDPASLIGCLTDAASNPVAFLDTYTPLLIARIAAGKYGYVQSDSSLYASVANFRTKLAQNTNTYIVNNYLPTPVGSGSVSLTSSPAAVLKGSDSLSNVYGYHFYNGSGIVHLAAEPAISTGKVLLADGCDVYVSGNLVTAAGGSLVIIARRAGGLGGNLYINPAVTRIDATIIADGKLMNGTLAEGVMDMRNWVDDSVLLGQPLVIRGTLHSWNHRGGSLKVNAAGTGLEPVTDPAGCRYFANTNVPVVAPDLETSRAQDLERFRVYSTLPPDHQGTLRVLGIRPIPSVNILKGAL